MKPNKENVSINPAEEILKKDISQAMEICTSNPIEGIQMAKKIYVKVNNSKEKILKGKVLNVMGFGYYVSKDYTNSLKHLYNALSIFQQKEYSYGIAESQIWLGLNYRDLGEFDKALEYHLNSLALSKRNGYKFLEGRTYSTLGMIYFSMENNNKAIDFFEKALVEPQNNKDITLSNLASTYIKVGKYKKALEYLKEAYKLNKPTNKLFYRAFILSNWVTVLGKMGKYQEALSRIKELKRYQDSFKDTYFINQYYSCLIGIYLKCAFESEDKLAAKIVKEIPIRLILKELKASVYNTDNLGIRKDACIRLINYYEQVKKWRKVSLYQKKLMEINTKNFEKEKMQATQRLSILHEVAKKEQKIKIQQLELEKNEIELKGKKALKEINQYLEEKVVRRTAKLTMQNQQLREFAFIVAHDLREPLCNVQGIVELLNAGIDETISDESKWLFNEINGCVISMNQLLKDLLEYTTIDQKIDESLAKNLNCMLIVEEVKHSLEAQIAAVNPVIKQSDLPTIHSSKYAIQLILKHLLSNALTFRSKDNRCEIAIDCIELADYFQFSVSDNGIGIKKELTEQIFRVFQKLNRQKSTGTGIGLAICKKAVQLIGGEIFVESTLGKGSTFYFKIPK